MDGRWKARLAADARAQGLTARVLDLATGTAAFPLLLRRLGHRGPIVGLDLSAAMLARARAKCAGIGSVGLIRGDLARLPLAEGSFDAVTIGYGLRYPADLRTFLECVFRILRPGGRFLSLDFGLPETRPLRALALGYLLAAGALWGLLLHGRPGTYVHIVESLRAYPGQSALAAMLREIGFAGVTLEEHLGGIAVTARAHRP